MLTSVFSVQLVDSENLDKPVHFPRDTRDDLDAVTAPPANLRRKLIGYVEADFLIPFCITQLSSVHLVVVVLRLSVVLAYALFRPFASSLRCLVG